MRELKICAGMIYVIHGQHGCGNAEPQLMNCNVDLLKKIPRPLDGGKVFNVTQDGLIRAIAAAFIRAKIVGITFHVLRHEFTTRMIEAGWSMAEVQATTGHSTAEMLRRYTHVNAKNIAAQAQENSLQ